MEVPQWVFKVLYYHIYFKIFSIILFSSQHIILEWRSLTLQLLHRRSNSRLLYTLCRKQAVDFDVCKRNLLLKLQKELDKSKKGSVDEPVVDLVNYINKTGDYCTTSSCSGRFAIFCAAYNEEKGAQISVLVVSNVSYIERRKVVICGTSRCY